jgi:hypothetical protein
MTSFQMQDQFIRINLVAIIGCAITMYTTVIYFQMGIPGYIFGAMSRFLIEIIYEICYLSIYFPREAWILPSMNDIKKGIGEIYSFSVIFVFGFSMEVILFEATSLMFFQAPNPEKNLALWMSLYQIGALGKTH